MNRKKSAEQNPVKIVIIVFVMVGLILGYYFHISNKTVEAKEPVEKLTETDEVLLRSLSTDYPPSPKELVKYYAEITKCFYDGNYTDEQLKKLAVRSRELFDDELLMTQSDDEYLKSLKEDISDYSDKEIRVSSYSTSSSIDVNYSTVDGREMASLYCLFNMRQGSSMVTSNQLFILRKDTNGHWKILGWTPVKNEDNE